MYGAWMVFKMPYGIERHDGAHGIRREVVVIAATLLLLIHPIRILLGGWMYWEGFQRLDDPATDYSDVQDLSEGTFPRYVEAIGWIERAISLDPGSAEYRRALSDIKTRMGIWAESLQLLHIRPPADTQSAGRAFADAANAIEVAIQDDPASSKYHLARGRLAATMGDFVLADREYRRALLAYPVNVPVRYAVASEYLAAGQKARALEQAKVLIRLDDSYRLPDTAGRENVLERRGPSYMARLSSSYLYKALEIIWRASDRNLDDVRSSVPDNEEARDVLELFLDSKGIDEVNPL